MKLAGRSSSNKDRSSASSLLKEGNHPLHLLQRWGDQARETDQISSMRLGRFKNILGLNHDTKIDYLKVVALKNQADNILTNIVHVSFYCRHNSLATSASNPLTLF